MHKSITNLLVVKVIIVRALDKNQKVNALMFQRFGTSNTFVKVTAHFLREAVHFDTAIEYIQKPVVTYLDEIFVLPF